MINRMMKNKFSILWMILYIGTFISCGTSKTTQENKDGKNVTSLLKGDDSCIINSILSPRQYEDKDSKNLKIVCIEGNDIIPSWCFSKIPALTDVILSNQVSTVEDNAFYGCKNLKRVNLESVIHCGESAFKMTSLETVSLKKCQYVDDFAFANCMKLNAVYFSSSIKNIGDFSFYADSSLVTIEIPNGEIGKSSFMGCTNLKKVTLGKVIRLGEASFMGCSALEEIFLSQGIKAIEPMTFQDCANLNSIFLPEGIEYIAENAFQGTGLNNVTIPSSVIEIKKQAFTNCKSLKTVFIHNKNTVISSDAFDKNVIIEYKNR